MYVYIECIYKYMYICAYRENMYVCICIERIHIHICVYLSASDTSKAYMSTSYFNYYYR